MSPLKALIFAVDGTLSETAEVHRTACNAAFHAFSLGFSWDPELYRELMVVSGGRERIEYYLKTYSPPGADEALARLDEIYKFKSDRYLKLLDNQTARLRSGVERLVSEARVAGVKLAIATTTSLSNVEALLMACLDFEGLNAFDVIVTGDMVAHKKPAPDVYKEVLRRLKLPAQSCLALEDSAIGLTAATAAGLRTIITPSLYTRGQDFTGAFAVLSSLGDPFDPYEHLAGVGEDDRIVSIANLNRWMADDDDIRALLTIGGRPVGS
ncbi:Phosphorylated carbohydrates phosphatase [Hartmannibacter diazotrophicus]|uniref:Phosphorylated carbohydrates phosphatase n=1 Tax=Hartmannibacter diazotrophicus TaxID=1482074 RepID=A0A2C9D879_9HYPH|nr:HAD-IA family hydrolase [Hartmannibacter diazotrophicus]SON55755.1 Phosphorylated carbohydrates phosphatase [Hartmannibacter diazotrophicus]